MMFTSRLLKHPFFLLLFCAPFVSRFSPDLMAQPPGTRWHLVLDGYSDVYVADVVVDAAGNTYAGVNYTSDLRIPQLNKQLPHASHVHGLILKVNVEGKMVWAHPFTSAYDNRIRGIALAANGDLLVTGFGDGLLCFPGLQDTLKTGLPPDAEPLQRTLHQGLYAARYTADGERKWVQYWNCNWGEGLSIAANTKDEVFLAFYHQGPLLQNGKLIAPSSTEGSMDSKVAIARLGGGGELQQIRLLGYAANASSTVSVHLQFDQQDNLLQYGTFSHRIALTDKDSLVNNSNYDDIDSYLAKYNPKGDLLWARKIGGQYRQQLKKMAVAPDNSIYGTGIYDYECVVGDGVQVLQRSRFEWKANSSAFYLHFFENGELDFVRYEDSKGYHSYVTGESLGIDGSGKVHLVGNFNDTFRIEGTQISALHDSYTGFYSRWNGPELLELVPTGNNTDGFLNAWHIAVRQNTFVIGSEYDGKGASLVIDGKSSVLPNKDYGRAVCLLGGAVPAGQTVPAWVASDRVRKRRMEYLKPLFACATANANNPSDFWFPDPGALAGNKAAVLPSPCGIQMTGMDAVVYPNPTKGQIKVKLLGLSGRTQIDVFAASGQLMLTHHLEEVNRTEQLIELDLSMLVNSTYLLRVTNKSYQKGFAVVKVQ